MIAGPKAHWKTYRQFPRGFFAPIVIDECHQGSAAHDSSWREISEFFPPATRIGPTATPNQTNSVSGTASFGEPVYSCPLNQGIRDGFLAPCKVVKVQIDRDVEDYWPEQGQLERDGEEVEDRIYDVRGFDRTH